MKWRYLIYLILSLQPYLKANNQHPSGAYVSALKKVTDMMVNDVTSPVASARYYAYTTMSAYEVIATLQPKKYKTLGKISFILYAPEMNSLK